MPHLEVHSVRGVLVLVPRSGEKSGGVGCWCAAIGVSGGSWTNAVTVLGPCVLGLAARVFGGGRRNTEAVPGAASPVGGRRNLISDGA